jgi:hypothetical protein
MVINYQYRYLIIQDDFTIFRRNVIASRGNRTYTFLKMLDPDPHLIISLLINTLSKGEHKVGVSLKWLRIQMVLLFCSKSRQSKITHKKVRNFVLF